MPHAAPEDKAVVDIQAHGIKITVEEGRSIQANAYLQANTFSSYTFTAPRPDHTPTPAPNDEDDDDDDDPSPHCSFGISLSTMLECLNIFEESGIVTRCEITTYEPDELMDLPFDDDAKIQKLIMKSEWLRDAFNEIDPSSEKITITFSPAEYAPTPYNRYANAKRLGDDEAEGSPTFRLESHGTLGSSEMDYPNDRDVLETFDCQYPIKNSYKFSHVQLTIKALMASTKTSIRTADDGLISFQFMIPLGRRGGESNNGFVEFLCVPLDDEH
ncbi:hypothetical protein RQP46_009507 [Phenoliferia psychrophenolica]